MKKINLISDNLSVFVYLKNLNQIDKKMSVVQVCSHVMFHI